MIEDITLDVLILAIPSLFQLLDHKVQKFSK